LRNIGLSVKPPHSDCDDTKCPFHSNLSVRGRIIEGTIVRDQANNTVVVRRDYYHYIPKYMRYERRQSRISAHNPPCIDAKIGEKVKIMECRPLSKSIAFVVIEKNKVDQ